MFAVGARWSALGVGVGLGEGRRRPRSAVGDEERERETRRVQNGTERVNRVLFDCLTTYTGMSYILWGSRRPCGTYKAGQRLCAPSDLELGTWSSGLGVPLGSVEHGGRVVGDLRDTLDVDPNPNGILPLHLLVTLNTDPWSVIVQWAGQRKREGVVGGSVSAGIENPRSGRAAAAKESRRRN